jgi:hypothetical protein
MFKNRIDTSGYKEGGVMGGETIDYPGRETVLKHQQELRETARRERSEGLSEGRTEERLIIQSIGKYMREHPEADDHDIEIYAVEKHGITAKEADEVIALTRELIRKVLEEDE